MRALRFTPSLIVLHPVDALAMDDVEGRKHNANPLVGYERSERRLAAHRDPHTAEIIRRGRERFAAALDRARELDRGAAS
jgi:hypothetical protein